MKAGFIAAVLFLAQQGGEKAYVVRGPGSEIDLATQHGTYSIILRDGCGWVQPSIEVMVDSGPEAMWPSDTEGSHCQLASVTLVGTQPCEQDAAGDCQVALADMGAPEGAFQENL